MTISLRDGIVFASMIGAFFLMQLMPNQQPIFGTVLLAGLMATYVSTIARIVRSNSVEGNYSLLMASLGGMKAVLFLGIVLIPGVSVLLVSNLILGFIVVVGGAGVSGYFLYRAFYQPLWQAAKNAPAAERRESKKYSLRLYAIFAWVTLLLVLSISIFLRDVEPYKSLSLVPMFSSPLLLLLLAYVYVILPRRKLKGVEEAAD